MQNRPFALRCRVLLLVDGFVDLELKPLYGRAACETITIQVKIFVQQKVTRRFLSGDDSWTMTIALARSFPTRSAAVRYCQKKCIFDVQAVLRFETTAVADVILFMPISQLVQSAERLQS